MGIRRFYEDPEVVERVERLEIPFNEFGLDHWGLSRRHLVWFYSTLKPLYRGYFRVRVHDIGRVPARKRAMVVGNHSGGIPVDAGMVLCSLFFDHEPPRHAHGMVEKFAQRWPFVSSWFDRIGQFTGLPEHAVRLLEEDRVLMVFPEGVRGTGKPYWQRYRLQRFGTGFVRLALKTKTPIVPFAFIGGEEAFPTLYHSKLLARLTGAPYWPVPAQIVPVPLPERCDIYYGEPMFFAGTGQESDDVVLRYVLQVKQAIAGLIAQGLRDRGKEPPEEMGADRND